MSARPSQFDSHRFVKRLTSAGVSEEVAEILAEEHASLILPADVATRADVVAAKSEVAAARADVAEAKADIAETRTAMEVRLAEIEERIRAFVREDILAAEARIRAELTMSMATFRDAVADYKTSTLKWMFGMMTAFTGMVVAAVVTLVLGLD